MYVAGIIKTNIINIRRFINCFVYVGMEGCHPGKMCLTWSAFFELFINAYLVKTAIVNAPFPG